MQLRYEIFMGPIEALRIGSEASHEQLFRPKKDNKKKKFIQTVEYEVKSNMAEEWQAS
jgi:hypothetical protein